MNNKELHTETIKAHIAIVKDLCYKMGIPELGKTHDSSKFSEEEFEIYKYADGTRSPHDIAREKLGVSPSWVHHKAKNQHHWEYWTDFNSATPNGDGTFTIICKCVKMPYDRVIEMFCDFVGAGKVYNKDKWTVDSPLRYWFNSCENKRAMHKDSEALLVKLLTQLATEKSLNTFIKWYLNEKEILEKEYEIGKTVYIKHKYGIEKSKIKKIGKNSFKYKLMFGTYEGYYEDEGKTCFKL